MKYIFTLLLFVLLTAACSTPQSIIRLTPINGSGKWVDGQELHTFENDSLRIVVVSDFENQQKLAFVVTILNKSQTDKLFSPAHFQVYPLNFRKRNKYNYVYAQIEDTLNADDPEQMILQEQYRMASVVANMQNNATWSLLHATVHLATDILTVAKPSSANVKNANEQNSTSSHENRYENNLFENGQFRNAFQYMSSENAITVLKAKAFRKNTVSPGSAYGGTIQFPRMNYTEKLALRIKIANRVIIFQFQQKIYIQGESVDN